METRNGRNRGPTLKGPGHEAYMHGSPINPKVNLSNNPKLPFTLSSAGQPIFHSIQQSNQEATTQTFQQHAFNALSATNPCPKLRGTASPSTTTRADQPTSFPLHIQAAVFIIATLPQTEACMLGAYASFGQLFGCFLLCCIFLYIVTFGNGMNNSEYIKNHL